MRFVRIGPLWITEAAWIAITEVKAMRFEVFKGKTGGEWFVRAVASNGQTVVVTEGYSTKSNALRSARRLRLSLLTARIVVKE